MTRSAPVESYASFSVTMSVDPYGTRASSVLENLRHRLDRDAPGALAGGDPAIQYDITQAARRDTLVLIPLVLAVILIVIVLLLRAIVAPLVLVVTTALSFAASFGLANLLWRYGLRYPGIQAQLPLYIFIFLVALGVDYNIFLSARIREETRQLGTRRAPSAVSALPAVSSPPPGSSSPAPSPLSPSSPPSPSPRSALPSPSASCSTRCSCEPSSSPQPCSPSESASGGPHASQDQADAETTTSTLPCSRRHRLRNVLG